MALSSSSFISGRSRGLPFFSRASLIVLAVSARYLPLVGRGMIRIRPEV